MKIQTEHLNALHAAVAPLDTAENRAKYLAGTFPNADRCKDVDMRYRWDLLAASKLKIGDGAEMPGLPLYSYIDDAHIDIALRSIVPALQPKTV